MNLKQLNVLIAVAEYRGFSAAASALHTTQSNISAHISKLETELGVKLIERSSGRLTKEGLLVVEKALKINAEVSTIAAELDSINKKSFFSISLGIVPLVAKWFLPLLLSKVAIKHPFLNIIVVEGSSKDLESKILAREISVALLTKRNQSKSLEFTHLYDEYLVLAYPKKDPNIFGSAPKLADLCRLDMIMPSSEIGYRFIIDQLLSRAGLPALKVRIELASLNFIAEVATALEKPTIIPKSLITSDMRQSFHFYALPELPVRNIGIATLKDYPWSKELSYLIDTIIETMPYHKQMEYS